MLDECDIIKVEDASIVVMVKVKEIDTISNMYQVCRNEGFDDIKIHHIGGLWVWIQFNSEKSCAAFKSNESLKKLWITSLEVSPYFVVDERMIWIEIYGLPLCAWGQDISSNGNVDPNEALNDFIKHVLEEKEVEKTPFKDSNVDDSKPLGFEKGPIYNNDDVTSRAGDEDVSFSTDQVKDNRIVTHKDMATDEVVLDDPKPPGFENLIKKNKACFSFIVEMNRMIELGRPLGYDVKRKRMKRVWIKELCFKHNVHILDVQETKMSKLEPFQLRSMWGNFMFDYACSMARGRSGGLVTLWDPNIFAKKRLLCSDNYIIVEGKWKNSLEVNRRGLALLFLVGMLQYLTLSSMTPALSDLPMGGQHFTWVNKVGSKMSKLDRLLISDDILHSNTDLKVVALDRLWSDHNPILLYCKKIDYGPIPFKKFNSWFDRIDFEDFVKEKWAAISDLEQSKPLHTKLKDLKSHLKLWYAHTKEVEANIKKLHLGYFARLG
ncbi:RNA-directed DNA polymerase, eukaryota, reverse transcriptase zinc-binding domain protein [Tanacetum coccineum]